MPMPATCTPMPPDTRFERLGAWLREQGDDAPGILEALARAVGLDAILLPHGDLQHRLHRVGGALTHEIGRIQSACTGRKPYCMAAALREVERAVATLRAVNPQGRGERHPMADYARFGALAEQLIKALAVGERDAIQRAWLVTGARELIGDLQEGMVSIEDADPGWSGWAAIDPPRGTIFDREPGRTARSLRPTRR